jgi:hypothetical protein
MNVNGEEKWFKIGYKKIWIHILWKFYTNGKYIGEYKDGKLHGQGIATLTSKEKYVGEFKNGSSHGQGTLTYKDGRKYEGEWKDDKEWNVINYNINGKIQYKIVNGERQDLPI